MSIWFANNKASDPCVVVPSVWNTSVYKDCVTLVLPDTFVNVELSQGGSNDVTADPGIVWKLKLFKVSINVFQVV